MFLPGQPRLVFFFQPTTVQTGLPLTTDCQTSIYFQYSKITQYFMPEPDHLTAEFTGQPMTDRTGHFQELQTNLFMHWLPTQPTYLPAQTLVVYLQQLITD